MFVVRKTAISSPSKNASSSGLCARSNDTQKQQRSVGIVAPWWTFGACRCLHMLGFQARTKILTEERLECFCKLENTFRKIYRAPARLYHPRKIVARLTKINNFSGRQGCSGGHRPAPIWECHVSFSEVSIFSYMLLRIKKIMKNIEDTNFCIVSNHDCSSKFI